MEMGAEEEGRMKRRGQRGGKRRGRGGIERRGGERRKERRMEGWNAGGKKRD